MTKDEFFQHAVKAKSDRCLEWPFRRDRYGYGECVRKGTRKAHRIVYEMLNGLLRSGDHVIHSCDNRACCNPTHLSKGTHADNMRDMGDKGRAVLPNNSGEKHGNSVLTENSVRFIRSQYEHGGVTQSVLAERHGISRQSISDLLRRVTWPHVA